MKASVFGRLSILLLFLLLGFNSLEAKQIGNRYQGSAKALEGNIYVFTCYVSETGWSDE